MARKPKTGKAATSKSRKPPRNPKTSPSAPGADPNARGIGDNSSKASRLTAIEEQNLFLHHRTSWNQWQAKFKVVEKIGIDVKAALKADGFTVKQFQIADQLTTVKGEVRVVGEVSDRLKVARWIGHAMGNQFDLFEGREMDVPVRQRAYGEGREDSIANKAAKPEARNYAPATPGYDGYMNGYHDHQEELSAGFKQQKSAESDGEAMSGEATAPGPGIADQTSGEPVTRSEFSRRLRESTRADESGAPATDKVSSLR